MSPMWLAPRSSPFRQVCGGVGEPVHARETRRSSGATASVAWAIARCFLLRNVPGRITVATLGFGWEGCKSKISETEICHKMHPQRMRSNGRASQRHKNDGIFTMKIMKSGFLFHRDEGDGRDGRDGRDGTIMVSFS